jgi:hypothetical protein
MSLKNDDFMLRKEHLHSINEYLSRRNREYSKAEGEPHCGFTVEFEWIPGLGRFVTVKFSDETEGQQIDGL